MADLAVESPDAVVVEVDWSCLPRFAIFVARAPKLEINLRLLFQVRTAGIKKSLVGIKKSLVPTLGLIIVSLPSDLDVLVTCYAQSTVHFFQMELNVFRFVTTDLAI